MERHPTPSTLVGGDDSRAVRLSVIIATYNARAVLENCLASILDNPASMDFEIIVVDDASVDGTSELVAERFPAVRLLRNPSNVNYGCSNNRAMAAARGAYFYLLNNDTIMLPGALDAMVDFLDHCPTAGGVGSKLLNEDGSIQWSVKSLPNPGSGLFGARSPLTRWFPDNPYSRKHLLHIGRNDGEPFVAPYVSSASFMLRREVAQQVGGLDERLTYHVDADYCKRISDAGWQVYYLPAATVVHLDHKGGTLVNRKRRFKAVIEFHRGSYIYYRKHIMRLWFEPMHLVVCAGLGVRFALSMTRLVVHEAWLQLASR